MRTHTRAHPPAMARRSPMSHGWSASSCSLSHTRVPGRTTNYRVSNDSGNLRLVPLPTHAFFEHLPTFMHRLARDEPFARRFASSQIRHTSGQRERALFSTMTLIPSNLKRRGSKGGRWCALRARREQWKLTTSMAKRDFSRFRLVRMLIQNNRSCSRVCMSHSKTVVPV